MGIDASFSHYTGTKGNRYRIMLPTKREYNKDQLGSTVEAAITLINAHLKGDLLASAKANNTWSQPWYYPRKPENSIVDDLYIEHLDGEAIEVIEPLPSIANVIEGM